MRCSSHAAAASIEATRERRSARRAAVRFRSPVEFRRRGGHAARHAPPRARSAYPAVAMPARLRLALFVTATLVLVAALGVTLFARTGGRTDSVAFAGALRPDIPPQDFRLRDQDGRTVSLRQFRGQVVVLTVMYTTCRDPRPLTATQIRAAPATPARGARLRSAARSTTSAATARSSPFPSTRSTTRRTGRSGSCSSAG